MAEEGPVRQKAEPVKDSRETRIIRGTIQFGT